MPAGYSKNISWRHNCTKKFMHLATAKEKNSGTFSEPKASMSYGEKITCIQASREKKFLVHERVKRNRACAKSPTTPVNPKKIKGIIFVNHLAQVQLLSQPILEHGFHVI